MPPTSTPAHHPGRSAEQRRQRVARFGGTIDTENAVEAGLIWLAAHQENEGHWDRFEFQRHCPPDAPCAGRALNRVNVSLDAGLTGLCLLAFLGAGYTDREGPHQRTVARGIDALLRAQQRDGGFCSEDAMAGYNNALATFALAEFHALTADARVVAALERAVVRLVQTQQPPGGWDYLPRSDSGRNDTSITAWAVQALQAAAAAGVAVPHETLVRAALHFARATADDGRVWYADAGTGFSISDQMEPAYRHGPAMTAAGLSCGQLLGWRADAESARRQIALLLGDLPSADVMQHRDPTQLHDYYYWYYGTVALFQFGGDAWERWNGRLRDALLPLQNREKTADGKRKHAFGSWPAYGQGWGKWGRMGSRVYTTALGVLTLEIYYRHTPAYLDEPAFVSAVDWREILRGAAPRGAIGIAKALGQQRLEIGEPVLAELLFDADADVSLTAALELADLDSPLGLGRIEAALPGAGPLLEGRLRDTAARLRELKAKPAQGTLRIYDARRRLATLELSRSYVGMKLKLSQPPGGQAEFRVIQRFSGRRLVVAEQIAETSAVLQAGQTVTGQ